MNIIIKIYEFLNFILGFLIKNETISYVHFISKEFWILIKF